MELWLGALNLGLLYAFLAYGSLLTFRILDFSDITVDGSFTTGAAVSAILIVAGMNPFTALLIAFLCGAIAGAITGIIHTRLKINGLLAGIIVMVGLYSINLHIMGKSNVPLLNERTIIEIFASLNPGLASELWYLICFLPIMAIFWFLLSLFFKTDLGIAIRAAGTNTEMSKAAGINVNSIKIWCIAAANGLVGLSGGLVAQYQGFADIGMGIGTLIIGLASVIIGESILPSRNVFVIFLAAVIGSTIYRLMIAFALYFGMNPIDLKLLTAVFVLLTLILTKIANDRKENKIKQRIGFLGFIKKYRMWFSIAGIAIIAATILHFVFNSNQSGSLDKYYKIGVLQLVDNGLLNVTRDSFNEEMKKLGYISGENCLIDIQNANGDISIVNSVLDNFVMKKYDAIVAISTPVTQAAINKIKDIPIVFSTVANPFIIKAGNSDTDHLPNVTGVYGAVSMDSAIYWINKLLPLESSKKFRIGAVWDPSQANSEFNVDNLKKSISQYTNIEFIGAHVTSTAEVHQAASSVAAKDIDMFFLVPDNTVYSAFDAVVSAAKSKNIPIFISDIERIADGALMAYGYDYTSSGIQAANIVHRILNGENPKDIPFEIYNHTVVGINMKVAKSLNIKVPNNVLSKAEKIVSIDPVKTDKKKVIGVIQFSMEPNVEICKKGILLGLQDNGYVEGMNVEFIYKNAQADFAMISSIAQDLIRRGVDVIVPLSTPVVQATVQAAANSKTTVVYTYIFDPYGSGLGTAPDKHVPNATGVACFPPYEKILDLIKEMFPQRKNVGIVWNSSESNSVSVVSKIKEYAKQVGLNIVDATVTNPSEVLEASRSIISKGADVFLGPGDNTLNVSFDSFVKVANENKVPIFTFDAELIENGATIGLGPDYFQTGFDGGVYLARVLNGESTANIPIMQTKETLLYINLKAAQTYDFKIDNKFINQADKVIR